MPEQTPQWTTILEQFNNSKPDYKPEITHLSSSIKQRHSSPTMTVKHIYKVQIRQKSRTRPPPLFKCIPPSHFDQLKMIILEHYPLIHKCVPNPRFIPLRHKTLSQALVRATVHPTDDQLLDLAIMFGTPNKNEVTAASLPQLKEKGRLVKKCGNPRCTTCQHLQCQTAFTSTKTKTTYPIRHYLSCKSKNVIYLLTCTKCRKQYVGMTLNVRMNHHRTSIFNKQNTYLHKHFNLPDHSIQNLTVQAIDQIESDADSYNSLQKLEKYWIKTLKTFQPIGLNVSTRL